MIKRIFAETGANNPKDIPPNTQQVELQIIPVTPDTGKNQENEQWVREGWDSDIYDQVNNRTGNTPVLH